MAHRILDTHQRQRILRPVRMLLLGEQGERERTTFTIPQHFTRFDTSLSVDPQVLPEKMRRE